MTFTWVVALVVAAIIIAALVVPRLRRSQPASTRASARLPLEIPVRLHLGEREVEVLSADISRGGMCVVGEVRTSAGQPVEIEFALPGEPAATAVHGVVRWAQRGKLGLLFDLQDRRRIAIGDWIAGRQAAGSGTAP